MSRLFPAGQFEHNYLPHKLGNWEVPDAKQQRGSAETQFGTLRARRGTTKQIVDERGHLLPGVPKIKSAFNVQPRVHDKSPKRWPQDRTTLPAGPAATMGYKGIQTDFLPSSTVTIKTVEIPGVKERLYQ